MPLSISCAGTEQSWEPWILTYITDKMNAWVNEWPNTPHYDKKKKKGGDTVMTFWEPILNTVILIFLF